MICDGKSVAQIKRGLDNKLVASFSNEEHNILLQEILFEKYFNEIKSLGTKDIVNK